MSNQIVSDEQAKAIADLLVEIVNDEKLASLYGEVASLKDQKSAVMATLVNSSQEKTVASKEYYALCHPAYVAKCAEYAAAYGELEAAKAKIKSAETVLSVWQTAERARADLDRRMR